MSTSAGRKEGFKRATLRTSMFAGFVPKVGSDAAVVIIQGSTAGTTTAVATEVYFVDVVTTAPITLTGTPTIDGVDTSSGSVRVLVTANADEDECGIFEIGADWNRITGFTRPFHVQVTSGTLGIGTFWYTPDGSSFAMVYADVRDGAVTSAKLADHAVTTAKVADDAITEDHIGSGVVDVALEGGSGTRFSVRFDGESVGVNGSNQLEVPAGGINAARLAENAVTSGKIDDGAVTMSKLDTTGASAGYVLTFNGTSAAWVMPAATHVDAIVRAVTTYDYSGNDEWPPSGVQSSSKTDGVSVAAGQSVLVNSESDQTRNGIYTVGSPWTRSGDALAPGMQVQVMLGGTSYGGYLWYCRNTTAITLGTTNVQFAGVRSIPVDQSITTASIAAQQLELRHISGYGSTPSISAGPAAGTSPTVSPIVGTDLGGKISITTGSSPATDQTLATVTFASAFAIAPRSVVLFPGNRDAGLVATLVYIDSSSMTTGHFVVKINGGGALATATSYVWYYLVIG